MLEPCCWLLLLLQRKVSKEPRHGAGDISTSWTLDNGNNYSQTARRLFIKNKWSLQALPVPDISLLDRPSLTWEVVPQLGVEGLVRFAVVDVVAQLHPVALLSPAPAPAPHRRLQQPRGGGRGHAHHVLGLVGEVEAAGAQHGQLALGVLGVAVVQVHQKFLQHKYFYQKRNCPSPSAAAFRSYKIRPFLLRYSYLPVVF